MGHLIEIYKSVSSQLVAYGLGRSQSKVTISTAIALVTFYMIYRSTQPPARLRHIPHVSFFTYLGAFVRGKSLNYVAKNIIMPVAMKSENGVYIVREYQWIDSWRASLLLYGLCNFIYVRWLTVWCIATFFVAFWPKWLVHAHYTTRGGQNVLAQDR